MNNVQISGVLVSRHDDVNKRKVPRTVLEIYNNDVHDVIRAVIYGRRHLDALIPEIAVGTNVQVVGRLTNVRWRTPGAGRTIREIGIDVHRITPVREGDRELDGIHQGGSTATLGEMPCDRQATHGVSPELVMIAETAKSANHGGDQDQGDGNGNGVD